VTDIRDDALLIERMFDAPRALVFRLWAERDHVMRWWGPEEFTTTEFDWALVPGRPWRGAMASKQYGVSRFGGVVREVERDRRIVFTFQWESGPEEYRETLVTVTFAERDGKTVQTFHQAPFDSVESRDSHVGGWNSLFNRQKLYVENTAVAEREGADA
jgi:uncharacterized protein YndB with AHSA1/START domain